MSQAPLSTPQTRAARKGLSRPLGLGTAVKMVTSAIGIKPCGGCKKRAAALDAKFPNINPFSH